LAQYKLPVKTKFISTSEHPNNSDDVQKEVLNVNEEEVKS